MSALFKKVMICLRDFFLQFLHIFLKKDIIYRWTGCFKEERKGSFWKME